MKKNLIISSILGGIALVCSLLIALINSFTSPIVTTNNAETEAKTIKAIYQDYVADKSETLQGNLISGKDSRILKIVNAKNSSGDLLGTVYTVSARNAYGVITIMVAINDEKVDQVEFIENGQSFGDTVAQFVRSNFISSKENINYLFGLQYNATTDSTAPKHDAESLQAIDSKCGATYGANLVKELVSVALTDAKGGN